MRVLVCGGRNFSDGGLLYQALDDLHEEHKFTEVIEGGASGADEGARSWAKDRGVDVVTYWANWFKYGKAAGPIRNEKMISEGKPTLVVAFEGGYGTAHMIATAERHSIKVVKVRW